MKDKIKKYLTIIFKIILFVGFIILFYVGLVFLYKNLSDSLAKNILEYLRVLAWPVVVLLIAFTFRTNIARLIERIEEWEIPFVGKGKAHGVLTQQQEAIITNTTTNGEDFNAIVTTKEAEITALKDNSQQLVDKLTRAQIELDFERIYNFIFANQIILLNEINNLGGEVAFEYIAEHYAKIQQLFGLKDWNPVEYLKYLVNNKLLEYKTTIGNFISVSLTTKGKAFISYVTARNYKKFGL